jgi:hypothetical protein
MFSKHAYVSKRNTKCTEHITQYVWNKSPNKTATRGQAAIIIIISHTYLARCVTIYNLRTETRHGR